MEVHHLHGVAASRHERRLRVLPVQGGGHGVHGPRDRGVALHRPRAHRVEEIRQRTGPESAQLPRRRKRKESDLIRQALGCHVRGLAPRPSPPLVQEVDRARHLVVAPGGCVHREAAARVPVRHQPVRRDPEERTGQHPEHARLVRRILQAAEEQEKRGQLVLEAHPGARHLDGQIPVLEGARVHREVPAGAGQNHEVARFALPGPHPAGDLVRDAGGLVSRHLVLSAARDRVRRQHPGILVAPGQERGELRLPVGVLAPEPAFVVEDALHQRPDRAQGAEVRLEKEHVAELCEALPDHLVERDVGAPEAVDALLGVPDHEERAGSRRHGAPVVAGLRVAREQQQDLGLQGIGVLELVDEDPLVAPAEVAARPGVAAQQRRRMDQQVLEVDLAPVLPLPREGVGGRPGHPDGDGVAVGPPPAQQQVRRAAGLREVVDLRAQRLGRGLPRRRVGPPLLDQSALLEVDPGHGLEERGLV